MGFGRGKGFTQAVKVTLGAILSRTVKGTTATQTTAGKLTTSKTLVVTTP